jgi:CRP/FNR family cyclic AMP-dependent transcriptional regulator
MKRKEPRRMNISLLASRKPDLSRLVAAVQANKSDDTLARFLQPDAWEVMAAYLSQEKVERGHILISQGALDRTLYFLESGVLRVHRGHSNSQLQLAVLGPGSVVGEGSFFSEIERNATVQATQPSVLWTLSPAKFADMSKHHPTTALALSMALGAVLSTRMLDVARRITVT